MMTEMTRFNFRRYYNLSNHADWSSKSDSDSMRECHSGDHRSTRTRKVRQNQTSYLQFICQGQFSEVNLRTQRRILAFKKASQAFIVSLLLDQTPLSITNLKPTKLSKGLSPLLTFLKQHKITVIIRLNSRNFRRIFSQLKRTPVLNRLLESTQIKLVTTIQTPKLLWRHSKFSFIQFWKLNLPVSVTKPRRQDQVLRGINLRLFKAIAQYRPMLLIRLMKRPEINRDLAVEWAKQLENPQILNNLLLVDV